MAVLGRVPEENSNFEYFELNYNYYNNFEYRPDYNPTFTTVDRSEAELICNRILYSGDMAKKCNETVIQRGAYYLACLSDVASSSNLIFAERSLASFAIQCHAYSSTAPSMPFYPLNENMKLTFSFSISCSAQLCYCLWTGNKKSRCCYQYYLNFIYSSTRCSWSKCCYFS